MRYLNLKKKKIFLVLYISILVFSSLGTINTFYKSESNDSLISNDEMEFNLNDVQFDRKSLPKWKEQISKADKNENGIDDNFEARLKQLSEFGFIEENFDKDKENSGRNNIYADIFKDDNKKTERITIDDIPIIISFPNGEYDSISLLFETLGGKIKSTYKAALNGFAGRISYNPLNEFCDLLIQNDIPFFIEEDKIYEAQLYYAGRNMNLRPYVWNTLSYDGDEYSSIAIMDTGIDDSHSFFTPGYSDADFNYKIVGWRDEIDSLPSPYDDNGHGSHCSGISAGEGGPNLDHLGRAVTTTADFQQFDGGSEPEGTSYYSLTRFNVTTPGIIDIETTFNDYTPGSDDIDLWVYLYYGEFYFGPATLVDSYEPSSDSWTHNLTYTVTAGNLGMYSFVIGVNYVDNTGDGYVSSPDIRFRSKIHWPFDPPEFGSGDAWKGVAPDAHLVGVKVLNQQGWGTASEIIAGINWVITNKNVYNITTMSLSLGGSSGQLGMITAVNNAVEGGIVTVVAAGNSGPGGNYVGSPGDADNVITVAANSINDEITYYSSQGGSSYTGSTTKPDITAPGGSFFNLQMFSADTGDNDNHGDYPSDWYEDDLYGAQGTSMSTPAVAGAANLLIEAMGGHQSWGFSGEEAKRVKALLLMSATETYPLERLYYGAPYNPTLDRGGKDVHEGYGRLNVDIAIEAYTQELALGSTQNAWIASSADNPFDKHGLGCYVNLIDGKSYNFTLDVPGGADFDLHLYSNNPSSIGEPIMVASSTSSGLGTDEMVLYTATETGKYYLVAKAISGEGNAIISYSTFAHDLSVSLEVPTNPEIDQTYIINATVTNTGSNFETNVNLFLYLDSVLVDSTTVSTLPVGASDTINYVWTPTLHRKLNFTAYTPPVPGESFTSNNIQTELIILRKTIFFEDFESGLSQWDTITGLWHLTNDSSAWPDPYRSPTHSMWFGNETTGNYDTGSLEMGDLISAPIDLSNTSDTILEFYHWKETEEWGAPYDVSRVYISTDNINWDTIYEHYMNITPWEKVSLNISKYAGNPSVRLRFYFDTIDSVANNYRGWLVDDIEILGTSHDPPGDFILSSNAGTPDKDGTFDLTWESADAALNYSVYWYTSYITEINGSLYPLIKGMKNLTLPLSGYSDGTYYFIVVANNTYGGTLSNCIEVVVEIGPPGDFILSSNAGTPDDNGAFDLIWTSAEAAQNYSVYQHSSYITEINGSLTSLINETEDLTLPLSGYSDGTYYFIVVANNTYGGTLSNCFAVVVQTPQPTPPGNFALSSNAGTPDNNGAFDLTWTSAAGAVSYSVYEYSSYITEINGSLTLLVVGNTNLTVSLSGYSNGTYFFIAVAYNAVGNTLSNCLEIVVQIPPEPEPESEPEPEPEPTPPFISGYNIFIFVPIILGVVMVIIRKQHKKRSGY